MFSSRLRSVGPGIRLTRQRAAAANRSAPSLPSPAPPLVQAGALTIMQLRSRAKSTTTAKVLDVRTTTQSPAASARRTKRQLREQEVASKVAIKAELPVDDDVSSPVSRRPKRNAKLARGMIAIKAEIERERNTKQDQVSGVFSPLVKDEDDDVVMGSVTTKTTKKRRTSKTVDEVRRVKREAPAQWKKMLEGIQEMRAKRDAEVDTMGCETFNGGKFPPHVRRFHTLVAAMLSSQTKDPVNAAAMGRLMGREKGLTVQAMLDIDENELAQVIHPVGFYRNKARYIKQVASILTNQATDPEVIDIPDTFDGLVALPGVGPKMAYLVMDCAWNNVVGICVDTHVHRISNRLGWVNSWNKKNPKAQDPEKTRADTPSVHHVNEGSYINADPQKGQCPKYLSIQSRLVQFILELTGCILIVGSLARSNVVAPFLPAASSTTPKTLSFGHHQHATKHHPNKMTETSTTVVATAVRSLTVAVAAIAAIRIILARKKQAQKTRPFPSVRTPLKRLPLEQMPKLKNDLLLRALKGEKTERVPVWCMRQAGRHLPEFRALRNAGYEFFTMCGVPEIAVEVSLQPLRRYHMDAVIIFSDILVIPQAMGMEVVMVPGVGPVLPNPIRHPEDIAKLELNPNIEKTLGYVMDALNLARQEIKGEVPLIGFVGAPLTLLCYMIEGGGSRTKAILKTFLYQHPQAAHNLLQAVTDVCVNFLIAQQRAGAQALQVFESVGAEVLTQEHYFEFAFPYMAQIAARVKDATPDTPIVCFSKGTPYAYAALSETQYDCLGLDWQSDPAEVRKLVKGRVSLQGNFDSSAIYASPEIIREQVKKMLKAFGTQGYVANFGHGCFPDMDPVHVNTFIKAVQEISLDMNAHN